MKFEVTILGSSSATPVYNRYQSAQVLNCNEHLYLIDCGEGTQQQLLNFGIKASKINHIFISHLHGDHFFGLVGLLSSLHLYGRTKPMHIFGPAPLLEILQLQFKHTESILRYPIEFVALNAAEPQTIFENNDLLVETIILNHRIDCTGFKFSEKKRLRKLIVERIEQDNVPVSAYQQLKNGNDAVLDSGKVISYLDYTVDSPAPRCYCYCSDTKYDPQYFPSITNCDLLYHEATFLHELLERANETHHTTARQAGEIATLVKAKRLLIGHFSSRYRTLDGLLNEARQVFKNTELAVEGKTYEI